jgi:integrase
VDAGEASAHTYDGHRKQLVLVSETTTANGRKVGDISVSDFTGKVLEGLVEGWEKDKKSQTTIRNRCASLMAMLNWAVEPRDDREIKTLIDANPIAGYELPKAVYQGDRYAPATEVVAFLDFVDQEATKASGKFARFERLTALLIHVVANTGCRPGELCVAEWKHYDPKTKTIVLPPDLHKTGRKTNKPRKIILPVGLAEKVEVEMSRPDRHPTHIFCHRIGSREKERDGAPLGIPWNSNALCKRVRKLRTAAIAAKVLVTDDGLTRLHLYRLRHSYATNAIQRGVSVGDTAALIGNSTKTTENTYLHYQDEHLRDVADKALGGTGK